VFLINENKRGSLYCYSCEMINDWYDGTRKPVLWPTCDDQWLIWWNKEACIVTYVWWSMIDMMELGSLYYDLRVMINDWYDGTRKPVLWPTCDDQWLIWSNKEACIVTYVWWSMIGMVELGSLYCDSRVMINDWYDGSRKPVLWPTCDDQWLIWWNKEACIVTHVWWSMIDMVELGSLYCDSPVMINDWYGGTSKPVFWLMCDDQWLEW